MSDPLNHLGSIWYHSEPSEVPYSPNQYFDRDFFPTSYSKPALVINLGTATTFLFVCLFKGWIAPLPHESNPYLQRVLSFLFETCRSTLNYG